MNNEELRNKCSAFEIKENHLVIFNHNYSAFLINYSFEITVATKEKVLWK